MKAQVDGVLGQLRAVMAKNKNRIIDTFLAFDANNSGTIDRNEFREAVLTLGVVAHKAALDALFDKIDADRGGSIDYRELDRQLGIRTQTEYSWSVARNNRPVGPGMRPFSASTSSLHRDYEQVMADRVASVRILRAQSAGRRPQRACSAVSDARLAPPARLLVCTAVTRSHLMRARECMCMHARA
jgi:hypothetical protein